MPKLILYLFLLLAATFIFVSCERTVPEVDPEYIVEFKGVPHEYGSLVAVTTMPLYPDWFQLWFEDDAGTIRIVRTGLWGGIMHEDVTVIPRTGAPAPQEEE